ncbi:MAG: ribbon-helix-helix domain-containing protein [Candidatus Diapherotrites archaeon]|nr:ribbon-helix-helix domain-containing protein [Candidatus Diapherotrites archaeon]
MSTTIITRAVDEDVEKAFRQFVARKYGTEKGVLSKATEDAYKKLMEEDLVEFHRRRAIERLEKGINIGFKGYKSRSELYESRLKKQLPRH